jgi:hypothetical protein
MGNVLAASTRAPAIAGITARLIRGLVGRVLFSVCSGTDFAAVLHGEL